MGRHRHSEKLFSFVADDANSAIRVTELLHGTTCALSGLWRIESLKVTAAMCQTPLKPSPVTSLAFVSFEYV